MTNLNEGAKLAAIILTASTDAIGTGTIAPSGVQITWDGADVMGNYTVTYADGGLTVTRLPVTVSAGTGRPTYLTVNFSEPVEGATFAVADKAGAPVAITEATASSDNRSYTLEGTFESGKAYTVAVTADTDKYTLTGSPVEISVTSGGSSGGGGAISGSYAVTVETAEHGIVTADKKSAAEGETVTLTVQADDGYHLSSLTVTAKDGSTIQTSGAGNGKYTFTMPADSVTVRASFAAGAVELPFADVHTGDWFHDAVSYVYGNGVMNGVSSTLFAPDAQLNRAMIAQILYNLKGRPNAGAGAFPDVSDSAWYADAVDWAAETGLVTGYEDNTFRPENAITREQLATILYRYAQYKGYDTTQGGMAIREYADYQTISGYAVDAMTWAVNTQLVNGVTDTTLQPQGTATRAQVAAILMRFLTAIAQ